MTRQELKLAAVLSVATAASVIITVLPTVHSLNKEREALKAQATTTAPTTVEEVTVRNPQKNKTDKTYITLAPTTTEMETQEISRYEVELIGRTIWGEAGGVESKAERAAVAWCILNRVDYAGQTIEKVVTAPGQFYGYIQQGECPQEHIDLAADVVERWQAEKAGKKNVGRVLPTDYLYFVGDGERNHFTTDYLAGTTWDWSLADPYK